MSITFPVDVANTRWSAVRISTNEIIKHAVKWPREDGAEIVGLDPDIALLREVIEAQPVFNPDTHRLAESVPVIDIPNNTHTHGWTVVALSQAELDAIAERNLAISLYNDLRDHVGTQAERATRLENVVAHLLKLQYDV